MLLKILYIQGLDEKPHFYVELTEEPVCAMWPFSIDLQF